MLKKRRIVRMKYRKYDFMSNYRDHNIWFWETGADITDILSKTKYHQGCDKLRIHGKSANFRYVDGTTTLVKVLIS